MHFVLVCFFLIKNFKYLRNLSTLKYVTTILSSFSNLVKLYFAKASSTSFSLLEFILSQLLAGFLKPAPPLCVLYCFNCVLVCLFLCVLCLRCARCLIECLTPRLILVIVFIIVIVNIENVL